MGFSCSPSLCLSCPFILCYFFFTPCGTCPSRCSKHQTSSSLRAPKLDCVPQSHVSGSLWMLPPRHSPDLRAGFPCWMWGELKPPWDPQQCYGGFAGVRSCENIPQNLFTLHFVSPSSFQGLKTPLGELFAGTCLLLGMDQWLGGERYY